MFSVMLKGKFAAEPAFDSVDWCHSFVDDESITQPMNGAKDG